MCGHPSYSAAGIHPQCVQSSSESRRLLRAPVLLSASADKPQPLKKAGGSWYRPCIRCGKLIHVRRLSCDCGLSVVRVEEPA